MTRLLGWLWNRALLYVLLVAIIAAGLLIGPTLTDLPRLIGEEAQGKAQVIAQVNAGRDAAQSAFEQTARNAKAMSLAGIEERIRQRQIDLADAKIALADSSTGFLSDYRPNKLLARKRAQIDIALIEQELALFRVSRAHKKAANFLDKYPRRPTENAVAAARQQCGQATAALAAFNARSEYMQIARETLLRERSVLTQRQTDQCKRAANLQRQRETHLRIEAQHNRAAALKEQLASTALPQDFAKDVTGATLRDILVKALLALIAITLTPLIYRTLAYFVLAPIAGRWPPMQFAPAGATPPQPVTTPSAISVAIVLSEHDEALVRQDYLQSSSLTGAKRTRWLLDWSNPLTSLASGMRFLTAIRGDGERVTVSAVKDPFAELAILSVPVGAACVVRPSALAAVVQPHSQPMRITSHWRLLSLPAWLTWQWRYLAFHGPVRLVVKGGRGVRIEPAERGRIVGEGQILGFSTDLAYAVIRSETFWPYFFGREALLKDKVAGGQGVLLIEEAPLAGRSGIRRGFAGIADALLKVFGV